MLEEGGGLLVGDATELAGLGEALGDSEETALEDVGEEVAMEEELGPGFELSTLEELLINDTVVPMKELVDSGDPLELGTTVVVIVIGTDVVTTCF
jgi:hypothetical protein